MQQPLADLYFLTVLEHLMNKNYPFVRLIQTAIDMLNTCSDTSTYDQERLIFWIELQAVIQVIAQQLATFLDPSEPAKIANVYSVKDAINMLMDNESTGGGRNGGHPIVIVLHSKKLLNNSSCEFIDMFLENYDGVFRGINCLGSFYKQLKVCVYMNHDNFSGA